MSDISYNRRVHYYIALYELFQEQECLHCMDIARKLSISLPAASRMLQKLISEGLIEKKSYQSICLTQAGKGQLQTTYHTYCELISYFPAYPLSPRRTVWKAPFSAWVPFRIPASKSWLGVQTV